MKRLHLLGSVLLVLTGCAVPETGITPPTAELYFPSGIAAHPGGRYLYVGNAVFDRRYNQGTVVVFDAYTRTLVGERTREIGLFSGDLVFRRDHEGAVLDLVTVSRDDGRLYRFDIDESGALDAAGDVSEGVAGDPFGVAPTPYRLLQEGESPTVMTTHISRGIVSNWIVDEGAGRRACTLTLGRGATSIARHPALDWAYVTDRGGNRISMVRAVASNEFVRGEATTGGDKPLCELLLAGTLVVDPSDVRGRTRGLAFSADGSLLFVASSSDDSLRVYDTSVRSRGRPRNALLRAIPIGDAPNIVRVAGAPAEGYAPDEAETCSVERMGQGLVYVTAFDDDRLLVIDPRALSVVARIDIARSPHDIAFACDAGNRLRAYVTAFGDHSISIVDIDPRSPERFSLLATVKP